MDEPRAARQGHAASRLFVEVIPPDAREVTLVGPRRHYVCEVLRMRRGDPLVLFDGSGWQYAAVLLDVTSRLARVGILERVPGKADSPLWLLLAVGLLKAQKMDLVIQKASELGAAEICPVAAARSVPVLPSERSEPRLRRWRKIAEEASRQSGRASVAEIRPVSSLDETLTRRPEVDLGLLFTASAPSNLGLPAGAQTRSPPRRILLLVGPEGGFTAQEEAAALAAGFVAAGLGPRILRAETAAILAVALAQYQFGDLRDLTGAGLPGT
ncbi:MAG: 16S rRNA (uracil(1498)-N(3))-methyltransferase [bacterium]